MVSFKSFKNLFVVVVLGFSFASFASFAQEDLMQNESTQNEMAFESWQTQQSEQWFYGETSNSCAIASRWVSCAGGTGSQFDQGCRVTCPANKLASCQPARAMYYGDPINPAFGRCELWPSVCHCKKKK